MSKVTQVTAGLCSGHQVLWADPADSITMPSQPGPHGAWSPGRPGSGTKRAAVSPGAAVALHVCPTGGGCRRLPEGQLGRPHEGTHPMSSRLKMRPVSQQGVERT